MGMPPISFFHEPGVVPPCMVAAILRAVASVVAAIPVPRRCLAAMIGRRRRSGVPSMADWSQTWTFFDGKWNEGNIPLWNVRTHAIWLGSSVFDGARVFEGVAPDLDLHCARVNASARTMHLNPGVPTGQWIELVHDGIKKFAPG